jgi:hypothetical protein
MPTIADVANRRIPAFAGMAAKMMRCLRFFLVRISPYRSE